MPFDMLKPFLAGAILMSCWAVALFFVRFFKQTRETLFVCFAIAFFLLGAEKLLILLKSSPESGWYAYLVRLAAFLLILVGIVNKNRKTRIERVPKSKSKKMPEHNTSR